MQFTAEYPDGGTPPEITTTQLERPASTWLPDTGSDTPLVAILGLSAILLGVILLVAISRIGRFGR